MHFRLYVVKVFPWTVDRVIAVKTGYVPSWLGWVRDTSKRQENDGMHGLCDDDDGTTKQKGWILSKLTRK